MTKTALIALTLAIVGCSVQAPAPPVPRAEVTGVNAPFNKTWDAVIDDFASQNVPIKTIDRTSGLIVAELLSVGPEAGKRWADCGSDMMAGKLAPTSAIYNVLVRGDSTKSTVRVTVRWVRVGMARGLSTATVSEECGTKAVWEPEFEARIKAAAESKK